MFLAAPVFCLLRSSNRRGLPIAVIHVKRVTDQARLRPTDILRASGDPRRTSLPCRALYSADKDELVIM